MYILLDCYFNIVCFVCSYVIIFINYEIDLTCCW